jgi:hypothetical protein
MLSSVLSFANSLYQQPMSPNNAPFMENNVPGRVFVKQEDTIMEASRGKKRKISEDEAFITGNVYTPPQQQPQPGQWTNSPQFYVHPRHQRGPIFSNA